MGRIVVTEYLSLDGVMEAPGPLDVEDFKYKGWLSDYERGAEGERFKVEETLASAALLLGRVTYETFVAAWPTMSGAIADKFNAMPKYVVSSTLTAADWTTRRCSAATCRPRSRACASGSTATSSCTAARRSCGGCSSRTSSTSCG